MRASKRHQQAYERSGSGAAWRPTSSRPSAGSWAAAESSASSRRRTRARTARALREWRLLRRTSRPRAAIPRPTPTSRSRLTAPEEVETPGVATIEGACGVTRDRSRSDVEGHARRQSTDRLVLALVRGDDRLSEDKADDGLPVRVPARDGRGDPRDVRRRRRFDRPRRLRRRRCSRTRGWRKGSLSPERTVTDGTCGAWKQGAITRPGSLTSARRRKATHAPSAAGGSLFRPRSRSGTSSSSRPFTQRRSMPPSSTRTAAEKPLVMRLLRHRTGPDDRRDRRAAPRRERDRLAPRSRALRRACRRARRAGGAGRARRRAPRRGGPRPSSSTIATYDRARSSPTPT